MTSGLKAIETAYHGCRFRSRTEARHAVFMDTLGVTWEYEREGFDLGEGRLYLPDFWLPDLGCWVEIKGVKPSTLEMENATALAEQSRQPVHLFWGKVASDPFWSLKDDESWGGLSILPSCECGQIRKGLFSRWTSWQLCHACNSPEISSTAPPCDCRTSWQHCDLERRLSGKYPRCYLDESGRRRRCKHDVILERAYAAAQGARFEHGESGARKPKILGAAIPWTSSDDDFDW